MRSALRCSPARQKPRIGPYHLDLVLIRWWNSHELVPHDMLVHRRLTRYSRLLQGPTTMKTLCCLLLLTIFSPVFAGDVKPGILNIDLFCQHWKHSTDEQQGEQIQVYRPANFKQFPPSRFRMEYVFAKDGTCKWMFLDPADAHHFRDGKWKVTPADKPKLQIFKGETTESYQVIELTKDLLRVKLVPDSKLR
jgi:hypothetical protein